MVDERPPIAAAVVVVVAGGTWATGFLLAPAPAGPFLGVGTWLVTLVTVAGLLQGRARWAVRLGGVVAWLAVPGVAVVEPVALAVTGSVTSVALVAMLGLPATRRLVRPHRAADAPPDDAVVLMVLLTLMPVAVGLGLVGAGSVPSSAWVLAVGGPLLAWWFGRVSVVALWLARLAVPLEGVLLAVGLASLSGVVPLAVASACAWFAWRPGAALAARPLVPTRGSGRPVFAELAPREVREAAGVDDRGHR